MTRPFAPGDLLRSADGFCPRLTRELCGYEQVECFLPPSTRVMVLGTAKASPTGYHYVYVLTLGFPVRMGWSRASLYVRM